MKSLKKTAAFGVLTAVSAAILTACGGGGGSAGQISAPYTIHLSAEKNVDGTPKVRLPLNLQRVGPNISGVHGPFTTALYVDVRKDGQLVEAKEDSIACNLYPSGLEIGALFYLNGEDETEGEGENETIRGSRQVALDAPSATFHFHALDTAGTATVRCSVQDPRDGQTREASIDITVGESTGRPSDARIETTTTAIEGNRPLTTIYTQNTRGGTTGLVKQALLQVAVFDDFNQPVPNPQEPNVYAEVLAGSPDITLRGLDSNITANGTGVYASTINGRATFTITSGDQTGTATILTITDRADNNVRNGIQDPRVKSLNVLYVTDGSSGGELTAQTATLANAVTNQPYTATLQATGGVPPYQWSLASGSAALPAGLSLSSEGIITGTPTAVGNATFTAQVRDNAGRTATQQYTIEVKDPVSTSLAIENCASGDSCELNAALVGLPYLHQFRAIGGTGTYQWSVAELPPFLTFDAATGQVRGMPACSHLNATTDATTGAVTYADKLYGFYVTVTSGTESVTKAARVNVQQSTATCP